MNSNASRYASLHVEARHLFAYALAHSSIASAMARRYELRGRTLLIHRKDQATDEISIELDRYDKIFLIALGKAANPMLDELLLRLPTGLPLSGICSAPSLPKHQRDGIRYFSGGHPLPNQDSIASARAALELLAQAGKKDIVFFLISGGGSAMFEAPLDSGISLEDTVTFHRALVGSGATIVEINTLRKHFSAVKGGRLALAADKATRHSLLVSDVPSGQLDALASGPTLPDRSTVDGCREILNRYRLVDRFPAAVQRFFVNADLLETPKDLPPDIGGANQTLEALLSNDDLVGSARREASSRGWTVVVDNECDDWDFQKAAEYLVRRLDGLRSKHRRVCLLSGGEVTVRLNENPGTGGRNQQFAMACALELAKGSTERQIAVLSAGSDGVDGVSPAAGAIADPSTVARAGSHGFDAAAAVRNFDCYPVFAALGDTVVTGPTGNNLRDLRILLAD